MPSKEQKESIVFYLLNCKLIYASKEQIVKKSQKVSHIRKTLDFCDPEKLNWSNVESDFPEFLHFLEKRNDLHVQYYIDFCNHLLTKWR
jgi:hypothetical protein